MVDPATTAWARRWVGEGPVPAPLDARAVRGDVLVRWPCGEARPPGLIVLGLVACGWPLLWLLLRRPTFETGLVVGPTSLQLTARRLGLPVRYRLTRAELVGVRAEARRLVVETPRGALALHTGWGAGLGPEALGWLAGLIERWRDLPGPGHEGGAGG